MNDYFPQTLAKAVQATGADYMEARNGLVQTLQFHEQLRGVMRSSQVWQEVWVARIAIGWREHADLYRQAEALIDGQLSGPRNITGTFSVDQRAKAVTMLGPDVVPRLVEIVWKTQEYGDDPRLSTVSRSLRLFRLQETAAPIRTLLAPETPSHYRHSAIATLGELQDEQSAFMIRTFAQDSTEDEEIRISALNAYAQYEQPDLYSVLSAILSNSHEPEELRIHAARILIGRDDPDTRDLFHDMIGALPEGRLLTELVDGLQRHGNDESIPLLQDLKTRTTDEVLRQITDETIEWIEDR